MAASSKILIIGGTGYIGRFVVKASVALGHSTFVLARPSAFNDPQKAEFLESVKSSGGTIVEGSVEDHQNLVSAIKQVDVVISTIGSTQLLDQVKVIEAIKEAGGVKRFIPSEFGNDPDKGASKLPLLQTILAPKLKIREAVKEAGIPYTIISSNSFAAYFLANLGQAGVFTPPRDKVTIWGDGNTKAVFVDEKDIGTYTIKAAVDPRTLNKVVYIRPPGNVLSHNEVVSIWEKKIGKELEKTYVSKEAILKNIEETPFPGNIGPAFIYTIFVEGTQTNFEVDLEASKLYPDVEHTTVDAYLSRLA